MNLSDKPIKRWSYEYWYVFLMIIYMGQMTEETSRLVRSFTGDYLQLLIPVFATLILLKRNKISLSNNLYRIIGFFLIWLLIALVKFDALSNMGLISFNLFLLLSIALAYIHVNVYGISFFDIFEDVIVYLALISIPLWAISAFVPASHSFLRLLPETEIGASSGTHLFYLWHWFDPLLRDREDVALLARNSGMTWEPGRFAVILCVAIANNLSNYGIKFRDNKNIIILLIALITTFSTTGYSLVALIYFLFYVPNLSFKNILKIALVVVPTIILLSKLSFMGDKIMATAEIEELNDSFYAVENYNSSHGGASQHYSLDRFQSLFFEFENIKNDPIIGYTRQAQLSWFGQNFSSDYSLTGGLLKLFGQFGLIFGLYLYYLLFKSSKVFSENKQNGKPYLLVLIVLVSSISYAIFGSAVFTTFWLFGAFGENEGKSGTYRYFCDKPPHIKMGCQNF